MGRKPHVLLVPFPAQGHIAPLFKLATKLAEHGIDVTFVNSQFMEAKLKASMPKEAEGLSLIRLVSIPDGVEEGDDRTDIFKTVDSMFRVMPVKFKELIEKINQSSDCEKISYVIADTCAGWALDVAQKMGIPQAAVLTYAPENFALILRIQNLREAGILDSNGNAKNDDELISVSEKTLGWKNHEFPWCCRDPKIQKFFFEFVSNVPQYVRTCNWVLCNSFYELDPASCDLIPNILTIGYLAASNHSGHLAGNVMPVDSTCLSWLDKQPIASVIYVALGSSTTLNQQQFQELALGLESSGHRFLWVVRSDLVNESTARFPNGFEERIANQGMIVAWAPQEQVLAHPSVACFLTHCGWGSVMESLIRGVPFLCWPYHTDHYQHEKYICKVWKTGFEIPRDENGFVTRHEIHNKVTKVFTDEGIKANALKLKEIARRSLDEGGSSFTNFNKFIALLNSS